MSIKTEALAFLIWKIADPLGWDVTIPDIAQQLDKPESQIRAVCNRKGWSSRVRASRKPKAIPAFSQQASGDLSAMEEIALY